MDENITNVCMEEWTPEQRLEDLAEKIERFRQESGAYVIHAGCANLGYRQESFIEADYI